MNIRRYAAVDARLRCWPTLVMVLGFAMSLAAGRPATAQELTVSTAASLRDAFTAIARRFEASRPDVRVILNLGSSGILQRQIEQGAPADVFASAAAAQIEALDRQGLLLPGSRRTFAGNRLVLIIPQTKAIELTGFADLAAGRVKRIAIGEPGSVPAGAYARQVLRNLGLWPQVQPKLIYTTHVRQALDYTVRGEVDAAVVYASDVLQARDRVRVVATADAHWHRPIRYPVAVLKESRHRELAVAFVNFLLEAGGREILLRYGFVGQE